MKLRDITGERAVEVIADLIAPIASIASDQKSLQLFRTELREGETEREMAKRDLAKKIPTLLKTHKQDVLEIICAINDEEPDKLSVIDIIRGAIDLSNDQDFLSLFIYAVGTTEKTPPTASSVNAQGISEPEH